MNVYKVYSGKANLCMCGCAGKYSYTADGAVNHSPGYDVSTSVSERSVKIITNKVLRNSNKKIEENGRILVAYFE